MIEVKRCSILNTKQNKKKFESRKMGRKESKNIALNNSMHFPFPPFLLDAVFMLCVVLFAIVLALLLLYQTISHSAWNRKSALQLYLLTRIVLYILFIAAAYFSVWTNEIFSLRWRKYVRVCKCVSKQATNWGDVNGLIFMTLSEVWLMVWLICGNLSLELLLLIYFIILVSKPRLLRNFNVKVWRCLWKKKILK